MAFVDASLTATSLWYLQGTDLFRLSQMNDASETLHEIYKCLHRALCSGEPRTSSRPADDGADGKKGRNRGGKYEEETTGGSLVRLARQLTCIVAQHEMSWLVTKDKWHEHCTYLPP